MKTTTSIRSHRQRCRSSRGNVAILQNKGALLRYHITLGAMNRAAYAEEACCGACMFGDRFRDVAERAERCRAWLVLLLRKRDSVRVHEGRFTTDRAMADAIEAEVWP